MWKSACLLFSFFLVLSGYLLPPGSEDRRGYPGRVRSSQEGETQAFAAIEVYTVLDAGNDSTGRIIRNNATTGDLGGTTGLERGIAVRPGDPPIVYIARGATSTGDGRPGGVVGLAAIRLQEKTDGDFNPNTDPDLPLAYIDTGLIVSGGRPANFAFVQGITYDPVLDKVWVLDGTGTTPRVWYFDGGAVGGAPDGGDVSRTAVAQGIRLAFQADNTSGLGGRGHALAVRVDPQDTNRIRVALAMGNHLEVWESTNGLSGPWRLKWESAADPDGEGPHPPFQPASIRDVAFDEKGDVWVTHADYGPMVSSSEATTACPSVLHRYAGEGEGHGRLAEGSVNLPIPSFVLHQEVVRPGELCRGFNSVRFYRRGDTILLLAAHRGPSEARIAVLRYRREGEPGAYRFEPIDGFGSAVSEAFQDETLRTLRLRGSARETQPGGGTLNGFLYLSLPYASEGDLRIREEALYLNGFVVDGRKGQTLPTSGIIRVRLPSP